MGKRLFVGNISFTVSEDSLRNHFGAAGTVESVKIITDKCTGKPKGFGFVEMTTDDEAAKAISSLNGTDLEGRALTV